MILRLVGIACPWPRALFAPMPWEHADHNREPGDPDFRTRIGGWMADFAAECRDRPRRGGRGD
ncbi:MAG: hypothetical protein ACR2NA_07745 [Solirubrobacterales bacterium]